MQQIDWANVDPGIALLTSLLMLYLYFLPALLAFLRGHRRFWPILGLNIAVGWLQPIAFPVFSAHRCDEPAARGTAMGGLYLLHGTGLDRLAGLGPASGGRILIRA